MGLCGWGAFAFSVGEPISGELPAALEESGALQSGAEPIIRWILLGGMALAAGGMALGGWIGGVIFDLTGSYAPAFLVAFAFNAMNFAVMSVVHIRQVRLRLSPRPA